MKNLFLLATFFSATLSWSNPTTRAIDSLEAVLSVHLEGDRQQVDLLNNLGYRYWIVDPVRSILYGRRALKLAAYLDYHEGMAFGNRVVGVAYWAKGEFDQASGHLFESVKAYQDLGDELGEANAVMNLGLVFSALKRYGRALEYYEQGYHIFNKLGETGRIATTHTKIATVYLAQGKLDSAELFLENAYRVHTENNYQYGLGEVHNRMGILNFKRGYLREASRHFHESIDIGIELNDLEGLTKNYADLSKVYIEQNKLEDAENLLHLGVDIAREIGFNKWLKEMFLELRNIYEINGELEKSLHYFELYVQLKDSLVDQQIISNLISFETQIATIEQQNQLAQAKRALQTNRLITWLVLSVLVILLLVAYLLVQRARSNAKAREEESRKLGQELEYKNKELTSYALNLAQKNQLFQELGEEIKSVKADRSEEVARKIHGLEKLVSKQQQVDRDWEDFRLRFESIHEGFFASLLEQNASLTNYELRLCALIRLNFSMKEIGNILGIGPDSVKTARYRLKKKLNLSQEETLNEYLQGLTRA